MMLPTVAIVGRPNVGKSTLFNRLVRRRSALVADEPGLTRDRHYDFAEWDGRRFIVVDTGGFESGPSTGLEALVRLQAEMAIAEADLVLLVVDVRAGLTATDRDLVQLLRQSGKPALHVANKTDGPAQRDLALDLYSAGVGEVYAVSAEHGLGFDELIEAIIARLGAAGPTADGAAATSSASDEQAPDDDGETIRLALVGRPNAGKSALLNRLVGAERAIVSDQPGTTRDPVDALIEAGAQRFRIVDTAGIRRKHRGAPFIEQVSILRAQRAIADADVACLLIDASAPITGQDARIANLVVAAGCGLLLVFSKSDLGGAARALKQRLAQQRAEQLGFADFAPSLTLSSLTGAGVDRLPDAVRRVHQQCRRRIPTAELNRLVNEIVQAHAPPSLQGRAVRIYYATQASARPPTFVLSVNRPDGLPESYRRYFVRRLREAYGFAGAPLRLIVRGR